MPRYALSEWLTLPRRQQQTISSSRRSPTSHIASNASPIEMSAIRIIESDEALLAGALARIAAREGSIVVYATRQLEPSRRDTAGR